MVPIVQSSVKNIQNNFENLQQYLLQQKDNIRNQQKSSKQVLFALRKQIISIVFEICQDCNNMAALPQGAFAACKLREQYNERDFIVSRMKKTGRDKNDAKFFNGNKKLMEYSPVKYNEKLMKSIWGFYNRYSPHNIKSNEIVSNGHLYDEQQQSFAVASKQPMAERAAVGGGGATGMEWNFLEKKF